MVCRAIEFHGLWMNFGQQAIIYWITLNVLLLVINAYVIRKTKKLLTEKMHLTF